MVAAGLSAWAVCAVVAPAEDALVLNDGRRFAVTRMERWRGLVIFETAAGPRYSVPEADVVSPPLESIPRRGAREPRPRPTPRPTPPPRPQATPAPTPAAEPSPSHPPAAPPPPFQLLETVRPPGRWKLGFADGPGLAAPPAPSRWRGTSPVMGQDVFLALTGILDAPAEVRHVPVTSGISSAHPDRQEFFGRGTQVFATPRAILSAELFRPRDGSSRKAWAVKATTVFNASYLGTGENSVVHVDTRRGTSRHRQHLALEEAFAEKELFQWGGGRGFVSLRAGIQPFVSDFHGLVFSDSNLGGRLFGALPGGRWRFNLAVFDMLEKETNSGLNTFRRRDQRVFAANAYVRDVFTPGYTLSLSLLRNEDHASREFHYDANGMLVRPARVGSLRLHNVDVNYFGLAGQGRWGRVDVSHATWVAFGADKHNPIAARHREILGGLFAVEAALERGRARWRAGVMIASGEDDVTDKRASGFDAILDHNDFAGGPFSFWSRSGLPLPGTGVQLKGPDSLLPTLRSSKLEGQPNFDNPGLILGNLGCDVRLTPRLKAVLNLSYLWFHNTDVLELLLFQDSIDHTIGLDLGGGVIYRPRGDDRLVVAAGASGLLPSIGFDDLYRSFCSVPGCGTGRQRLANAFVEVRLMY